MEWANDSYTITAADAAAVAYVGRAWNSRTKLFSTVTDTTLAPGASQPEKLFLRCFDVRVLSALGIKTGVRIMVMTLPEPNHPGTVMVLRDGIQSAYRTLNWLGKAYIGAGFQWRIHLGALVDTDIVTISAGYERVP